MPGHARRSHKNPFCPMISITARAASARLRAVQARIPEPPGATPRPVRSQIGAARACEDEAAKYEGKLRSFVSASLRARMQTTQSKGQRRAGIPSAIRSLDGVWKSAEGWKDGWMDVRMYQKELQEVGETWRDRGMACGWRVRRVDKIGRRRRGKLPKRKPSSSSSEEDRTQPLYSLAVRPALILWCALKIACPSPV